VVIHFANLSFAEIVFGFAVGEERARVGHGGIKPQPVKIVAYVIVKADGFCRCAGGFDLHEPVTSLGSFTT